MLKSLIACANMVGITLILMPRRWRGFVMGLMASCTRQQEDVWFHPRQWNEQKVSLREEGSSRPIPAIFNWMLDDEATSEQTHRELPVPQCPAAGSKA
jgi:hypothetical protein